MYAQLQERVPGAEMKVFAGVRHGLSFSHPEQCAATLLDLLGRRCAWPIPAKLEVVRINMSSFHMFERKTVAITGAAGSLGCAVAEAFAAQGARLLLLDAKRELLDRVHPGSRPDRLKIEVDLLDAGAVAQAIASACGEGGSPDVLCAIAGGFHMGEPVHETSDEHWNLMMDVNVRTLLNTVRAVVPGMVKRGSGKIVTIGANAAGRGVAGMGAYCASKSAVSRITESMAAELRSKNINVNCVMPSIIDTPANRAAMPRVDPALWVAPAEVASVVLFLSSPGAKAIHGALIPVVGLS